MTQNSAPLVAHARVPAYLCPAGTKMHMLNLGTLQADEGFLIRGANTTTLSNPEGSRKRRNLIAMAVLIEHPQAGLILFETGCAKDLEVHWGAPLIDVFPRIEYEEKHHLDVAIQATGNNIRDVKAVIMGHLHIDHAGGLERFMDTNVPIYVHEEEFKHACWAVGTKMDYGVYLPDYMDLGRLNWKTFCGQQIELFQGLTMHHCPGHTPGLCAMQLNLASSGTFLFTTDQFHVKENYEDGQPQGWLARDHNAWFRSFQLIEQLKRNFSATLVFGHDKEVFEEIVASRGSSME